MVNKITKVNGVEEQPKVSEVEQPIQAALLKASVAPSLRALEHPVQPKASASKVPSEETSHQVSSEASVPHLAQASPKLRFNLRTLSLGTKVRPKGSAGREAS